MGEYLRPDVYVENKPSSNMPIEGVSSSTGGFIGKAPRGFVGVPTFVTSWNDFILKFARGLDTPFIANSDLAYSVYGFFLNGGTRCYVERVAEGAVKASKVIPETTGVTFTALDEGTWANTLKVEVKANAKTVGTFDVVVTLGTTIVEVYTALSNIEGTETYYVDAINEVSKYITVEADKSLSVATGTLTGGVDGDTNILDADYISALAKFDTIHDVNMLAIPGVTTNAVLNGILDYCANRGDIFPLLDPPKDTDTTEALALVDEIVGTGAMYGPWGYVTDPLSKTGKLRICPPSGHVMGIYARTDRERGVYKAPAGQDATVRGFVALERSFVNADVDMLNPQGFNCILARPNMGIVVFGARTLSGDPSKRYVSDVRLDIKIKVSTYNGTQWSIFEPNDADLWARIKTSLASFMYTLWLEGALLGETPDKAYYVKCDEELNPREMQDAGRVIAEVGYATKKPGEFIIIRFAQNSMPSGN